MAVVTIRTAKASLSQLVARAEAGEEIVLLRGTQPVAKIVPIEPIKPSERKRQFGAYRGKFSVGPEFFDPLPDDELNSWE